MGYTVLNTLNTKSQFLTVEQVHCYVLHFRDKESEA